MTDDEMRRFSDTISAVCPIVGVGDDGERLTYWPDEKATESQIAAAAVAAAAFVRSSAADAQHRAILQRREAAGVLLKSDDPFAVAVRGVVRALAGILNDTREELGLPRIPEYAVTRRFAETIAAGGGDAM